MSDYLRYDEIGNTVREKLRIAPILETIVEFHLRWFRHVWRKPIKASI